MLVFAQRASGAIFPGAAWEVRDPALLGLSRDKLRELELLVGGRGCVVRNGYMAYGWGDQTKSSDIASAFKPVLTSLLFMAVQEGKISNIHERVATFEPRLDTLNEGKDAAITWRHFAFQISGYGLTEKPGAAYSYNDYALALYYDTLVKKVFHAPANEVLRTRLATPLQFEDHYTFEAFGPNDRPGRLAISVRDFARFGWLYLRGGLWRDKLLIRPEFVQQALNSPLPADFPRTSGREAPMLPGQRSIGGTRNITPLGPGFYSFNWWLNRTNHDGRHLLVEAPPDTCLASGHGGMRMLWLIPRFDLIVVWNDAKIEDQDQSPDNPDSRCNRAAKLLREMILNGSDTPAIR